MGFTEPGGSRVGLGALLLGAHDEEGALRYAGRSAPASTARRCALREKLDSLERKRSALADPPRMRGVHWVEPKLVAEVAFTEWTGDGRIRHPVFLGLREDKAAREVGIEVAQPRPLDAAPAAPSNAVAGVSLSNPDRVYFPDLGVTKSELAPYYERWPSACSRAWRIGRSRWCAARRASRASASTRSTRTRASPRRWRACACAAERSPTRW